MKRHWYSHFSAILACLVFEPVAAEIEWPELHLIPFAEGLSLPTDIQSARDGSGRLFVVERAGRIRILRNGELEAEPFLDIRARVRDNGSEEGLLGLAFPPDFASSGFFFVNYTNGAFGSSRVTRISRFSLNPSDPDDADEGSEFILLVVGQPFSNHNAGQLQFGPDGFLYFGLGDGGAGGDPGNRAQSTLNLLGKMLRIDPDGDDFPGDSNRNYTIPSDNPFVGVVTVADEIWALGLRNPWRFAFDRATGDLYIADVGQDRWEEANFQAADSGGGENYGWRIKEGNEIFNPPPGGLPSGLTDPVFEYFHSNSNLSITGGYVYRGEYFPRMQGVYFLGDFGSGRIWGIARNDAGVWENRELMDTNFGISTFGENEHGELYVAAYFSGEIFRLADTPFLVTGAAKLVNRETPFLGNIYNGFELMAETATFSSQAGQITRISFLDPGGDLTFAEFGSPERETTLTIDLDEFQGPVPSPYNQPGTEYVKGRASFAIDNSTAGTFFSVFTLGNDPTRVDVALITQGTLEGEVDGIADVQAISIRGANGGPAFIGGINAANANFSSGSGVIGIDAADVRVGDFLFIGDFTPSGTAEPWIRISPESSDTLDLQISGGDFREATGGFQIDTGGVVYPFPFRVREGQRSINDSPFRPDLGDGRLDPALDTVLSNPDIFFRTDGQTVIESGGGGPSAASPPSHAPLAAFPTEVETSSGASQVRVSVSWEREDPAEGSGNGTADEQVRRSGSLLLREEDASALRSICGGEFPCLDYAANDSFELEYSGAGGFWILDVEFGWLWSSELLFPLFWSPTAKEWIEWRKEE